jgi:hypothetical protein
MVGEEPLNEDGHVNPIHRVDVNTSMFKLRLERGEAAAVRALEDGREKFHLEGHVGDRIPMVKEPSLGLIHAFVERHDGFFVEVSNTFPKGVFLEKPKVAAGGAMGTESSHNLKTKGCGGVGRAELREDA